jgi:hypothetical protein
MKKMVLVLTLAAFALSGSAFAQDPSYINNIGTYLTPGGYAEPDAEDGTGSCGSVLEDTPFTVFVVLSKLTNVEVWGWEAKITYTNMLFLGADIYGDHINAGTREDEYLVGLANPLFAVDGAVAVAELQFMVNSFYNDVTQPSHAFIAGVYFSLLPSGAPAYLEASGSTGVGLSPALGNPNTGDDRQLVMNGDCVVVGLEDSSWGNLKSLYR